MSEGTLVEAIDRIMIRVRNVDDAERIYTRILGYPPFWRWNDVGGGLARVIYRLDNVGIELIAPMGAGPWGDIVSRELDTKGEGMHVLILKTGNVVRATTELTASGLPAILFSESQITDPAGGTYRWRNAYVPPQFTRDLVIMCNQQIVPPVWPAAGQPRPDVARDEAIAAIDHVVVMTSDAEAVRVLFGDKFHIRLALDQTKPEWGVRQLFFRLGGVTLEVIQPLDAAKLPKTDAFGGLAWRVGDVGRVRARLLRDGVDVSELRAGRKKDTQVATIRRPTNGVPMLLIGPLHAKPDS